MTVPSLASLASVMTRYGSLTFGGGAPTVAALQDQTVERHAWLDPARFRLAFALSRLTPGTNLLAFCTALGWQMRGITGGVVALVAASLPCSIIAVICTIFLAASEGHPLAERAVAGASASATGIIAASCWHLVRPHWEPGARIRALVMVMGAWALHASGVPPVRILVLAAILGAVWRERT